MLGNLFEQMNLYLLSHPAMLAKLDFLFRLKCWLLILLMGYFLYLIYQEERKQKVTAPTRRIPPHFRLEA